MDNDFRLIDKLIKYTNNFNRVFPINLVINLDKDIIIERIDYCINNNVLYDDKLFYLNEVQIMSDNVFNSLISLIIESLNSVGYNYKDYYIEYKNTNNSFNKHLEYLILTMLSNQRWGNNNIIDNYSKILDIFDNFDYKKLMNINVDKVINDLGNIHCTNINIKKQIESIPYNINVLKEIENEYGSLDKYYRNREVWDIANNFDCGKYKLKQVGKSITFDYLKKLGIDCCKSTNNIELLFGSNKLCIVDNYKATEKQVIIFICKLSKLNNMKESEVEFILENFCNLFCNNNCSMCKLKDICNCNKSMR